MALLSELSRWSSGLKKSKMKLSGNYKDPNALLRKLANEKVVIIQCIGGWVVVELLWAAVGL